MPLVIANAGIPMLFFHLPAMILALVPVIVVEWFVAQRQFRIPKQEALKGVIAANCFSTLLGFPLFWLVGVLLVIVGGSNLDHAISHDPSLVRSIFEYGTGVIWLGPEASGIQIMGAGLGMLVPAFLVSVFSERWILRSIWKDFQPDALSRYTWLAHLLSYPVLVAVWLGYVSWIW